MNDPGNVPIKAKGANRDFTFDHHKYDNRVLRHDVFPNNPIKKPIGALRHDAPYEPSVLINWKGKKQHTTKNEKLAVTDPDFVPFIGFLKNEDRLCKLKKSGFSNPVQVPIDGYVQVKNKN
jgi:hypothetical protein